MTCDEVRDLIEAFVDAELPGPMLLTIARHAGTCGACDAAIRELTTLHEAVERSSRAGADALDLSSVWPAVAARVEVEDRRRLWRRRLRAVPAWGAVAAMAAGAVLWIRPDAPESTRVAARPRPNQTVIERLDTASPRVELRRERKNGTTLIMVSALDDGMPR
jgi:hypothetical protein